jgi:hypothetical protein
MILDVFDVYVLRALDDSVRRVFLLDINPFTPATDALLFSWDEILEMDDGQECEFRYIESEIHARQYQQHAPRFVTSRMPSDAVWLSEGQTLTSFAEQLSKELQRSSCAVDDEPEPNR